MSQEETDDRSREQHDWDLLWNLEQRLLRGERLPLDASLRELLCRVGEDVGFAPEYVNERLTSPARAEDLLRDERARIRDGSHGLSAVLVGSSRAVAEGNLEEARAVLERFITQEPVPYYRELARRRLVKLGEGQLERKGE